MNGPTNPTIGYAADRVGRDVRLVFTDGRELAGRLAEVTSDGLVTVDTIPRTDEQHVVYLSTVAALYVRG